jgi:DNA-binding CsgD family transcriptional regulator
MVKSTSVGTSPSFVVVDAEYRVRFTSAHDGELELLIANSDELQPEVEAFLHASSVESDDWSVVRGAMLSDRRVLRVVRVEGSGGTMFILSIEDSVEEHRDCLERAARLHQLTRRETEVLSLILDGSSAGEIAQKLVLSEHTVQGYFKRLLFKTGARNRVSMVAGIFNWDQIRLYRQGQGARAGDNRVLA